MNTARKLSWDPVRDGATYCAPACGRGCTFEEYTSATDTAVALAGYLTDALKVFYGAAWAWRVWENLGWHHEAVSPGGRLRVMGTRGRYVAFLGGGRWSDTGKTPEAAVVAVVRKAKADLDGIARLVGGLEDLV